MRPIRCRLPVGERLPINCGVFSSFLNNIAARTLLNSLQRSTIIMAEAVGLASGLLTLVVFTFNASKSLYKAISSLKSQRQTIKDILVDLDALVILLTTVHERAQRPTETGKLEPLRQPLEYCATTCKEMREMLDACTAHSKDGQASVRNRVPSGSGAA